MKARTYSDGYLEWQLTDEDGTQEDFAELSAASVGDHQMDLSFDANDAHYEVTLRRKDAEWAGRFERRDPGIIDPEFDRCSAREITKPGHQRTFAGKWFERSTIFRWEFLLRGGP